MRLISLKLDTFNTHLIIQVHMLIDCPQMARYRGSCGLGPFISSYRMYRPHLSSIKLYALFLSDSNLDVISDRTVDLFHMYLGWHTLMNIPI